MKNFVDVFVVQRLTQKRWINRNSFYFISKCSFFIFSCFCCLIFINEKYDEYKNKSQMTQLNFNQSEYQSFEHKLNFYLISF